MGKKAAVLSISLLAILVGTALSPALAEIRQTFPDASESLIQSILTLPSLFLFATGLVCPRFVRAFGARYVLIIGLLIFFIGGVGGAFAPNLPVLLALRAVLGIGAGLVCPMSQYMIGEHFEGDTRSALTGLSASVTYLCGLFTSQVIGYLAGLNWRYCFAVYGIAVAVLILVLTFLPAKPAGKSGEAVRSTGRGPLKPAFALACVMCLVESAFFAFSTNIALFMNEENLGGPVETARVVFPFMAFGLIAGALVNRWRRLFGRFSSAAGALMMAAGYLTLSMAQSMPVLMAGAALVGSSFSILYAAVFLKASNLYPDDRMRALTVSWCTSGLFLGQFLSPRLVRAVSFILRGGGYRGRFRSVALALLAGAALTLFITLKNHPERQIL